MEAAHCTAVCRVAIQGPLPSCGWVSSQSVCVFCRYLKKDEAVWYFSRQLCKAFVSVRRLKTAEMFLLEEEA